MDLSEYFRILHKNWLMIALVVLIGIGGAFAFSITRAPEYRSNAQLYVSVRSEGAATGDLVQGTSFARQIVASYVDVVPTALVLQPVIDKLGLDTTVDQLAAQVSADTPLNTVNINIAVTDTDPERAAAIADATAASLTNAVQNRPRPRDDREGAALPVLGRETRPGAGGTGVAGATGDVPGHLRLRRAVRR